MSNPGGVVSFFRSDRGGKPGFPPLLFSVPCEDVLRLATFLATTYPTESWEVFAVQPFGFPSGEVQWLMRPYESEAVRKILGMFGWIVEPKGTVHFVQSSAAPPAA